MHKRFEYKIPIRLVSEANRTNEHWAVKSKRHKVQQLQVKAALNGLHQIVQLPCTIVLTRLSSRRLDDDNLVGAFKYILDQVADCILPGMKKGRADGDKRLKWEYKQEKAKEKSVRIEIYSI